VCNHAWHRAREIAGVPAGNPSAIGRFAGVAATFVAVVVSWVIFRADSMSAAILILQGMIGLFGTGEVPGIRLVLMLASAAAIVFALPNAQQLLQQHRPVLSDPRFPAELKPATLPLGVLAGIATGALLFLSIMFLGRHSTFLYYQF
jgi:alginate O-acetyltransferase complex protein AlgI